MALLWETMGSLSLGETRRFLMVQTLCVGYDYVTLTLNFFGGSRTANSTLFVNPINGLTGITVESFLLLVQSPFGIFALGESFPKVLLFLFEQLRITAHSLALWERVLITLNLAERLWWLSHSRYCSVWVGFLYTVMDRLPSSSGFTMYPSRRWNHPPYCPPL